MGKQYTPSGKANYFLSIIFFFLTLVVLLLITEIAALIGLWLTAPLPYAGMILMFLSCWLISKIHQEVFRITKNRNPNFARVIIIVSGLITAFFHLATIVAVIIVKGVSITELTLDLGFIDIQNITIGAIALFAWPLRVISSFFGIGIGWFIYFVLTILLNVIIPMSAVSMTKQPFHEDLKEWMQKQYASVKLQIFSNSERDFMTTKLIEEDISPLIERPVISPQVISNYSMVTFYKIKRAHTGYVGIDNFYLESKSKDNSVTGKFRQEEFIKPIQVGTALAERLNTTMNSTTMAGMTPPEAEENVSGWSPYRRINEMETLDPYFDANSSEGLRYTKVAKGITNPGEYRIADAENYKSGVKKQESLKFDFSQEDFSIDDTEEEKDK